MADLWTYQIDSLNINDGVNFFTLEVPEIDNPPSSDIILVEHAGDVPDFVREQPTEGLFTPLLFIPGTTEASWNTNITALRAVLTPGLHTFTVQARGWPSAKSVQVVRRNFATNYKLRQVTVGLVAPNPNWA